MNVIRMLRTVSVSARAVGIVIAALFLVAQAPGPADTESNRVAAAQRYLAAVPIRQITSEMISEMARNMPQLSDADRQKFIKMMNELMSIEALERIALRSMVRHFTVDELEAMTRFYGSPLGKSIMKKFPVYMGEVMPSIQAEIMRAMQDAKERL